MNFNMTLNLAYAHYQRGRNIRNYTKEIRQWVTTTPSLLQDHHTLFTSYHQSVELENLQDCRYYHEQIKTIYYRSYR